MLACEIPLELPERSMWLAEPFEVTEKAKSHGSFFLENGRSFHLGWRVGYVFVSSLLHRVPL